MKIFNYLALGLIPFAIGDSLNLKKEEISNKLIETDSKFKKEGASLNILNEYDDILNEFDKLINSNDFNDTNNEILNKIGNIKFKHGIINLILKREKLSILDFKSCIINKNDKNNEFFIHNGCFEKFVKINLKFGNFHQILNEIKLLIDNNYYKLIDEKLFNELNDKTIKYKQDFERLNESINFKNWDECILLSDDLLQIGSNDDKIIRNKINCLMETNKEFDEKIKLISHEYNKLVNEEINEINLNDFVKFGEIELFGISGIYSITTDKIIRNCLKIDNEFEGCRNLNKINFKLNKIMKIINEISIYYSYIYSDTNENFNEERINDIEISREDWNEIINKLFNKNEKIKLKNIIDKKSFEEYGISNIDKFENNFEIILELFNNICLKLGFSNDEILKSSFLNDLFKLVKEGYYEIGEFNSYKKNDNIFNNKYYLKLKEMKNQSDKKIKDVVDISRELDKYIKKKKIDKAKKLLESLSIGIQSCKLIRERKIKIEEIIREEQQQQQQQQYHYQQQQQQQQQRRNPGKPFKPKNDYYKILGISKDANNDEIKKAYRQKMRENHPDKIKQQLKKEGKKEMSDEEIETQVAEINNAYEILSDEEKRKNYDQFGEDPNDPDNARQRQEWQQQQQFGGGGVNNGRAFHFQNNGGPAGGFPFNFGDFGGFGGFNGGNMKFKQRRT